MEKIEEINYYLRSQAKELNICDKFYIPWKGKTFDRGTLIDNYFAGLDFCLEHRFPSNEDIKRFFRKDILRRHNVLVDDRYSLLNPQYAVILGNSVSKIRFNGITVSQIYVRDTSTTDVFIKGHAHVIIHIYDNATVNIAELTGTNTPIVIMHSRQAVCNIKNDMVINIKTEGE